MWPTLDRESQFSRTIWNMKVHLDLSANNDGCRILLIHKSFAFLCLLCAPGIYKSFLQIHVLRIDIVVVHVGFMIPMGWVPFTLSPSWSSLSVFVMICLSCYHLYLDSEPLLSSCSLQSSQDAQGLPPVWCVPTSAFSWLMMTHCDIEVLTRLSQEMRSVIMRRACSASCIGRFPSLVKFPARVAFSYINMCSSFSVSTLVLGWVRPFNLIIILSNALERRRRLHVYCELANSKKAPTTFMTPRDQAVGY